MNHCRGCLTGASVVVVTNQTGGLESLLRKDMFLRKLTISRIHTTVVMAKIYIWEIKHLLGLLFSGK
jgi:hypothetical protein